MPVLQVKLYKPQTTKVQEVQKPKLPMHQSMPLPNFQSAPPTAQQFEKTKGSILTRESQQKQLFELKIKLRDDLHITEKVFNYDTPITICDRMLKDYHELTILNKDQRKMLQNHIEFEVNGYIKRLENEARKSL